MASSDSSAHDAHETRDEGHREGSEERHREGSEERRTCFYCLKGWSFWGASVPTGRRSTRHSAAAGAEVRAG
jgi:hypothetical protein